MSTTIVYDNPQDNVRLPDLTGYVIRLTSFDRTTETWTERTLPAAFSTAYTVARSAGAVGDRFRLTIARMESNGRVLRRPLVDVAAPCALAALRNRAIELTGNVHASPS